MWFHQSMDAAWENGISPAVTDAEYKPRRVDDVPHVDRIDHRIIRMIRESRFLVADVTGHRQGVYFEAGFALALDMPVIWACRDDHADEIHFDTRQFNHIIWHEPADLRTQLLDSIRAVIV
jgi:nucleoside 2-deoxyribosyltransferase